MKALDPSVRERLSFVQVGTDRVDLRLFPDFLLIGPQRTATTWMHDCLCRHPQVFMPDVKEIYYFNALEWPGAYPSWMKPFSPELSWYLDHFEPSPKERQRREKECLAAWGEEFAPQARGEATASYAAGLSEKVIDDIVALNPAIKVVLVIRNPIERAWSHAKKDLALERGRSASEVSDEEFIEFTSQYYQVACGRYSRILDLWRPRLQPDALLIERFERVAQDPQGLLLDVLRFLGLRADPKYVGLEAERHTNPTAASPIPSAVNAVLHELFAGELEWLAAQGWQWPENARTL
ncbi:MAG: sulfotransferase [Planctomycetota bacterium]